jgi:TolB-like protein/Flp pilus assembly protein TadD
VTREELRLKLWPADTVVDFDHGLNNAVNKVREALGDTAESPRYVETLPRRGYRFIAPVEKLDGAAPSPVSEPASSPSDNAPRVGSGVRRLRTSGGILALAAVVVVAAYLGWQRFQPQAAPAEKVMLAVLPFENLSADPEQEYFSDGMTEEMITQLGRLEPERLGVIARTSAMRYKATEKGIDEIGRELGVDYILEGSVRRVADRVRISAQLVQVDDQTHLWAQSYDRAVEEILALQSDVAAEIAHSLTLELLPARRKRLAWGATSSSEAHEAYLRGRYYQYRATSHGWQKAIQYFQEAIKKDPDYAAAYAGMGSHYLWQAPAKVNMPKAKAAALKALELDATLPEAYAVLGSVKLYFEWDWAGARKEFEQALRFDPGNAQAHFRYSQYLAAMGRLEKAIATAKRARELDPLSTLVSHYVGRLYYFDRQYERAVGEFKRTLELDPNYGFAHFFLALTYDKMGRQDEAMVHAQRYLSLGGKPPQKGVALNELYRSEGFEGIIREWARARERRARQKGFIGSAGLALTYARLGDKEKAFRWLERAYRERTRDLIYLKVDPGYDALRSDPRFQDLVRRVGFPGESVAVGPDPSPTG